MPFAEVLSLIHINQHVSFEYVLNELKKRDKMRGLPSILSLFRNEFNKFNNTGAQVLDYFLLYDIKYI